MHLQDVDAVGETVQQDSGQALRAEDLDERFRSGGGQGDEANSPTISRPRWNSFRCRLSSRLSSRAAVRFTPFSPARRPSTVPQSVYFSNMALLDHRACRRVAESGGTARASPSRRPWLETARFTAPAGNSPPFVAEGVAGKPGCRTLGRILYFCPFPATTTG